MSGTVIDNPVHKSPFAKPGWHWGLDDNGSPTGQNLQGRRRSEFIVRAPAKAQSEGTGLLVLADE